MEIRRDRYLNRIISYMWDGQVKVITGIRRCGKSYLLRILFKRYLLDQGVKEDHILSFELDLARDIAFRDPLVLAKHVREIVENTGEQYYLFVDEIQMSDEIPNPYNKDGKRITFYDALNDLKSLPNLDIYVTGSNSRMLPSDILTEFRGRHQCCQQPELQAKAERRKYGGQQYSQELHGPPGGRLPVPGVPEVRCEGEGLF